MEKNVRKVVRSLTFAFVFVFLLAGLIAVFPALDAIDGVNDLGGTAEATSVSSITTSGWGSPTGVSVESGSFSTTYSDTAGIGILYDQGMDTNYDPTSQSNHYYGYGVFNKGTCLKIDLGAIYEVGAIRFRGVMKKGTGVSFNGIHTITMKYTESGNYANATDNSGSFEAASCSASVVVDGKTCYYGNTVKWDNTNKVMRYMWLTITGPSNLVGVSEIEIFVYKRYTLTLDRQSGSGGSGSVTVACGSTTAAGMPDISIPSRTGYTFGGYYTAKNGGGTQIYDENGKRKNAWSTAGNGTIYAKWTINTYYLDVNGYINDGYWQSPPADYGTFDLTVAGTKVCDDQKDHYAAYNYNSSYIINDFRAGTGYKYIGTYVSNSSSAPGYDVIKDTSSSRSGTIDSYKQILLYYETTYTLTYNSNGGSAVSAKSAYWSESFDLPTPTKAGYTFAGWVIGSTTYSGGQSVSRLSATPNGSVTATAQWTANQWTCEYYDDLNGSLISTKRFTYDAGGQTMYTSSTAPIKAGYTFAGWRLYRVYDNSWGYTNNGDHQPINNWNTATTPPSGYQFALYSLNQVVTRLSTYNNDTVKCYAIWTANTYTVTFKPQNGGFDNYPILTNSPTATKEVTFGSAMPSITLPAVSSATVDDSGSDSDYQSAGGNYIFDGYWDSAYGSGTKYYDENGNSVHNWDKASDTTLYARWKVRVRLMPNGGSISGTRDLWYTYNEDLSPLSSDQLAIKSGYNFRGYTFNKDRDDWLYYSNTGAPASTNYLNSSAANFRNYWDAEYAHRLYAYWTPVTYSVTFNSNGGTAAAFTQNFTYDVAQNLTAVDITTYTRAGYTFLGWSTSSTATAPAYTNGQSVINLSSTQGATVPLYAVWARNYSFDTNGYINDTRWHGSLGLSGDSAYKIKFDVQIKLYDGASWEPVKYYGNATFNYKDSGDNFVTVGNAGLCDCLYDACAPEGAQFRVYNIQAYSSDYVYKGCRVVSAETVNASPDSPYSSLNTSNDVTVTIGGNQIVLLYFESKYSVTYSLGGASGSAPTETVKEWSESFTTPPAPSRSGYNFIGWKVTFVDGVDTNGSTYSAKVSVSKLSSSGGGSVILTAQWSGTGYSITYNLNGGSWRSGYTAPSSYTIEAAVTLPAAGDILRNGYSFAGWYANSGLTGSEVKTIPAGSTGNKTYWAKWKASAASYTVTLNKANGTGGTDSVIVTYHQPMPSAVMPTREGYVFSGYFDQANGKGTCYYTSRGKSARIWDKANGATLYAYWKADADEHPAFTLSFSANGGNGGQTASLTAKFGLGMPYPSGATHVGLPTRNNYKFNGYGDKADGTGKLYYNANGVGVRNWDKKSNTTLYAIWVSAVVDPIMYSDFADQYADGSIDHYVNRDGVYAEAIPQLWKAEKYILGGINRVDPSSYPDSPSTNISISSGYDLLGTAYVDKYASSNVSIISSHSNDVSRNLAFTVNSKKIGTVKINYSISSKRYVYYAVKTTDPYATESSARRATFALVFEDGTRIFRSAMGDNSVPRGGFVSDGVEGTDVFSKLLDTNGELNEYSVNGYEFGCLDLEEFKDIVDWEDKKLSHIIFYGSKYSNIKFDYLIMSESAPNKIDLLNFNRPAPDSGVSQFTSSELTVTNAGKANNETASYKFNNINSTSEKYVYLESAIADLEMTPFLYYSFKVPSGATLNIRFYTPDYPNSSILLGKTDIKGNLVGCLDLYSLYKTVGGSDLVRNFQNNSNYKSIGFYISVKSTSGATVEIPYLFIGPGVFLKGPEDQNVKRGTDAQFGSGLDDRSNAAMLTSELSVLNSITTEWYCEKDLTLKDYECFKKIADYQNKPVYETKSKQIQGVSGFTDLIIKRCSYDQVGMEFYYRIKIGNVEAYSRIADLDVYTDIEYYQSFGDLKANDPPSAEKRLLLIGNLPSEERFDKGAFDDDYIVRANDEVDPSIGSAVREFIGWIYIESDMDWSGLLGRDDDLLDSLEFNEYDYTISFDSSKPELQSLKLVLLVSHDTLYIKPTTNETIKLVAFTRVKKPDIIPNEKILEVVVDEFSTPVTDISSLAPFEFEIAHGELKNTDQLQCEWQFALDKPINYAVMPEASYEIKRLNKASGEEEDEIFLDGKEDDSFDLLTDGKTALLETSGVSVGLTGTGYTHRIKYDLGTVQQDITRIVLKNMVDTASSGNSNRGYILSGISVRFGSDPGNMREIKVRPHESHIGSNYSNEVTLWFDSVDARYIYIDIPAGDAYVVCLDEIEIYSKQKVWQSLDKQVTTYSSRANTELGDDTIIAKAMFSIDENAVSEIFTEYLKDFNADSSQGYYVDNQFVVTLRCKVRLSVDGGKDYAEKIAYGDEGPGYLYITPLFYFVLT